MAVKLSPKQYVVELLFILAAIFGFYLIVAWSSYNPSDSAWSVSSSQNITNKTGALGAWVIDVFFVLFGYVGNLLPFVICIASLYFIRTKRSANLTWSRSILAIFGFSLLMMGLTCLSTLLLNDSSYYSAGGVLGSSLYDYFLPRLGESYLLLMASVVSIIGFILGLGTFLIGLLIDFYYWLTMKNEGKSEQASEFSSKQPTTQSIENDRKTQFTSPGAIVQNSFSQPPIDKKQDNIVDSQPQNNVKLEQIERAKFDLNAVELPIVNIASQTATTIRQPSPQKTAVQMPDFIVPSVKTVIAENKKEVNFDDEYCIPKVQLASHSSFSVGADEANFQSSVMSLETVQQNFATFTPQNADLSVDDLGQTEQKLNENGLRTIPVDKLVELFGDHKSKERPTTAFPTLDLLDRRFVQNQMITSEQVNETSRRIEQQLLNFKIKAAVKDVLIGPVVTRYELELQPGVKASAVSRIDTDLARALTFKAIRVSETIPGKPYIGIETPNTTRQIVPLRDLLDSDEFRNSKALLPLALGKDISGSPIVIDLAKTPHLLVAGATGSGKSVGINTMILSLLFKVKPEQVKFIMIDPKVVELSIYNDIPHLLTEVVTDMKKAANALRWCVDEMERRYQLLSRLRVRNIEGFNERIDSYREQGIAIPDPLWKPGDTMDSTPPILERMSYIVVIVDEFADLMMQVGKQIEELIARLTQKARAVGIHVILATQRPSVDVITGLIKSNIPSRIAFTVVQRNDSRTILDQNGAEVLLGLGDMLYLGNGTTDLVRVHGAFVSDDESSRIADDWRARGKPQYISSILENQEEEINDDFSFSNDDELDPLFDKAVETVVSTGMTSTSFIQRRLKIGFNRAANIMDQLEQQGIVSEMRNGKRELLFRTPDF